MSTLSSKPLSRTVRDFLREATTPPSGRRLTPVAGPDGLVLAFTEHHQRKAAVFVHVGLAGPAEARKAAVVLPDDDQKDPAAVKARHATWLRFAEYAEKIPSEAGAV